MLNEIILATSNTIISTLVQSWIKKIDKNEGELKKNSLNNEDKEYKKLKNVFEEYLIMSFEKNKIMNTIVFRNKPIEIDKLYLPLTLVNSHSGEKKETYFIDNFPHELINKYSKIVIADSAGMGKSTLLKWIFINCILTQNSIPIFIELRKLTETNGILDEVIKSMKMIDNEIDSNLIFSLIKKGDFIFFLDGYDEISLQYKSEVTNKIQEFVSKNYKNKFILTSRPQSAIVSFIDFHEFYIRPLNREESIELINKYDENSDNRNQLIEKLNEVSNDRALNEFLTNPLMVSLLYIAYDYKNKIPQNKNSFYRQVYDALFEDHDLSKGGAFEHDKKSNLDKEKFHTVLQTFSFITLKGGKQVYSKDEIINFIKKAKKRLSLNFSENAFFDDLISSVPLFIKEGNFYNWKHKSLQDYFVAQFISTNGIEHQAKTLQSMYESKDSENYFNIFDLCYDANYKNFKITVIYKLLEEVTLFERDIKKTLKFDQLNEVESNFIKSELFGQKLVSLDRTNIVLNNDLSLNEELIKKITEAFPDETSDFRIRIIKIIGRMNNFLITLENKERKMLDLLFQKNENIFISESELSNLPDINIESISSLDVFNEKIFLLDKNTILKDVNQHDIIKIIMLFKKSVIMRRKSIIIDFDKVKHYKYQIELEKDEENDEEDFYIFK